MIFPRRRLLSCGIGGESEGNLFDSNNLVVVPISNANWVKYTYQLLPGTTYTAKFEGWNMGGWTQNQKNYLWQLGSVSIYESRPYTFTTDSTGIVNFTYSPSNSGMLSSKTEAGETTRRQLLDTYFRIYKEG